MFDFTLAKFMQVRLPVRVFLQIFSDVLRQQNVSGVATVHDPLCDIDASASHVRFSRCVNNAADRSTMYAHSQLKFRMLLERAAYFQRAFNRRFRAMVKDQRDAVACRDCDQAPRRFRGLECIRTSDNLVQALDYRSLLIDGQLRVADDVCEQHMRNFELNFLFNLSSHMASHGMPVARDALK